MKSNYEENAEIFADMYEQILWSNERYSTRMWKINDILEKYTETEDDVFEFVDDLYNAASPEDKRRLMRLAKEVIELLEEDY